MTVEEMFEEIEKAKIGAKSELAESLLSEYQGDDIEIVEPWLLEMAAIGDGMSVVPAFID